MLTIFSIPRPFLGHFETIQHNAIRSWTLLQSRPEIILFGEDEGTAQMANELSVLHMPEVARNEYGTPLLNDLFEKAQRLATHDLLCYVNADIILMSDFMPAVQQVASRRRRFLIIGQRWDVETDELWDFGESDWAPRLKTYVKEHGKIHPPSGIDYFVFPRGMWGELPLFAIGRTAWDCWLIYRARSLGVPVIDATGCITAVHQNHDYPNFSAGADGVWKGPEAKRNLEMAGGYRHVFTLQDATHKLTPDGLRRELDWEHLVRYWDTIPILHPRFGLVVRLAKAFIRIPRLARSALNKAITLRRWV
jgi:hypothetical protein